MMARIVIVGAGGFGRETLDVIAAINNDPNSENFEVVGVVDAAPSRRNLDLLKARGTSYLGTEEEWFAVERRQPPRFVVGVGNPDIRAEIVERWVNRGYAPATLVHPFARLGSMSRIGAGSVVCSGAQVSTNVAIGSHVHINPNVTVGHDSVLRDFVSVNPGAVISGDVRIDSRALIGAGAVVLQGLSIGASSTVGAAACVVTDVPAAIVVKGVPAR